MTFVSRLIEAHRFDRAVAMLDEVTELLSNDPDKLTEVFLRRALCHFAKQDNDKALYDVTHGLNARADFEREKQNKNDDVILEHFENTVAIATRVFDKSAKPLPEVIAFLDKSASRLAQEERFKSAVKLENLRTLIDICRALLALQPDNTDVRFKLASNYSKFGQNEFALRILNQLVEKNPLDFEVLAARASCFRELGNEVSLIVCIQSYLDDVILTCYRVVLRMTMICCCVITRVTPRCYVNEL